MADRDSILTKLEALMKRTRENGASEAEVESAMAVARKLMDANNIEMEELLFRQTSNGAASIEIKEEEARTASKLDRFERYLMSTAAAVCDVKWYYSKSRVWDPEKRKQKSQVRLVFYGMPQDVLAARLLFLELIVIVRAMARTKVGKSWSQRHYYYCDGFCAGLLCKADQLKEQSNSAATSSTSLILRKDLALAKYGTEVLCVRQATSRPMGKERSRSTEYNEGWCDGHDYDLNPKNKRNLEEQETT